MKIIVMAYAFLFITCVSFTANAQPFGSSNNVITSINEIELKPSNYVEIDGYFNILTQQEIRFNDLSGGQYVSLKAPATVSSSVDFVLPDSDGSSGEYLITDGIGNLSFSALPSEVLTETNTKNISNKTFLDALLLTELGATPSTPSAGLKKVYCLSANDKCYQLNDAGSEVELGGASFIASNDNRVLRSDTVGADIQESGVTLDDTDSYSGVNSIELNGDSLLNFTEIVTPSTPATGLASTYIDSTTKRLATIDDSGTIVNYTGNSGSQIVRVATGNGHGSTNTAIRRFSVTIEDTGADITYADSATLGATFTINADGSYIAYYNDERNSVVARVGVSIDSTQLTTTIRSIIQADRACISEAATPEIASCTAVMNLSAGAVVRAHTGGAVTGGTRTSFTIIQVEKF